MFCVVHLQHNKKFKNVVLQSTCGLRKQEYLVLRPQTDEVHLQHIEKNHNDVLQSTRIICKEII